MQEYRHSEIVKSSEGDIKDLTKELEEDLSTGKADSARIALIEIGDEFEIKGLKFKVTKKHNRKRITAKLIGN